MQELNTELRDNYEQLRKERGWSYDTLADSLAQADPRLSAYFRGKASATSDKDQAELDAAAAAEAAADLGGTVETERAAGEARRDALQPQEARPQDNDEDLADEQPQGAQVSSEASPSNDTVKVAEEQAAKAEAATGEAKKSSGRPKQADVPTGNIDEVTGWVGDDPARAKVALAVENKKDADDRRTSLIEQLDKIVEKG